MGGLHVSFLRLSIEHWELSIDQIKLTQFSMLNAQPRGTLTDGHGREPATTLHARKWARRKALLSKEPNLYFHGSPWQKWVKRRFP
jgi:hypothetical protein